MPLETISSGVEIKKQPAKLRKLRASLFVAGLGLVNIIGAGCTLNSVPPPTEQALKLVNPEIDRTDRVEMKLSRGVSYFVLPHPDDELAALAPIQRSRNPIFVLMTRGDRSIHCRSHGGIGSQKCMQDRITSWNKFLDNFQAVGPPQHFSDYDIYRGRDSARLIFDIGDRHITADEVIAAINIARQIGQDYGPEEFIVSSAQQDGHPDHDVVTKAVESYKFSDKLIAAGALVQSYNLTMPVENYSQLFDCQTGLVQQAYGWLTPSCWQQKGGGNGLILGPVQRFREIS